MIKNYKSETQLENIDWQIKCYLWRLKSLINVISLDSSGEGFTDLLEDLKELELMLDIQRLETQYNLKALRRIKRKRIITGE